MRTTNLPNQLPYLPGNVYADPTITRYHKTQLFGISQGTVRGKYLSPNLHTPLSYVTAQIYTFYKIGPNIWILSLISPKVKQECHYLKNLLLSQTLFVLILFQNQKSKKKKTSL